MSWKPMLARAAESLRPPGGRRALDRVLGRIHYQRSIRRARAALLNGSISEARDQARQAFHARRTVRAAGPRRGAAGEPVVAGRACTRQERPCRTRYATSPSACAPWRARVAIMSILALVWSIASCTYGPAAETRSGAKRWRTDPVRCSRARRAVPQLSRPAPASARRPRRRRVRHRRRPGPPTRRSGPRRFPAARCPTPDAAPRWTRPACWAGRRSVRYWARR